MSSRSLLLGGLALTWFTLSACGESPTDLEDAATDADVFEITPPAAPSPPVFTPCPDGWREVEDPDTGLVTCDPWPAGGPEECPDDQAHFPGEPGCTLVGTACTTDDWAEGLPTDREILYVQAGAASGGEGTRDLPFSSIAEAMPHVSPDTIIALSKGSFDEQVNIPAAVTLWGACAAETTITCSIPDEIFSTIEAVGMGAEVRNLTVSGERGGIAAWGGSAAIHVEGVIIENTVMAGISVSSDGRLTAARILVRDTRQRPSDGWFGRGLNIQDGAEVEVHGAVLERNMDVGIFVADDTIFTGSDLVVRDTQCRARDLEYGRGFVAQNGATCEIERAVLERNREIAIHAQDPDTSMVLTHIIVTNTLKRDRDDRGGRGLNVQGGASVEIYKALFEDNREVCVHAQNESTEILLEDVVLRDTRCLDGTGFLGRGLNVQEASHATVRKAIIDGHREAGVFAFNDGTLVALFNVVVSNTLARCCAETTCVGFSAGSGMISAGAAHVEMTGFELSGNHLCGLQIGHGDDASGERLPVGGTTDLHDGWVVQNAIGANIQTEGFDISRLMDNVAYLDNDRNLDTEYLPIPDHGDGF